MIVERLMIFEDIMTGFVEKNLLCFKNGASKRKSFTTINTIIVKCNITVYCNKMTFENVFPKGRKNKILKNSEHRKCYILRKKEIGNGFYTPETNLKR